MIGNVEKYLIEQIKAEGSIHMTLIDPEKVTAPQASRIIGKAVAGGTSAVMIGGSTFVSGTHLDNIVRVVKRTVEIPVILFPNNVSGISRYADAMWFMSLLNSADPYFIMGAQVLGAPLVRKYRLEPIPLGYIIVGEGCTAGIVGKAVAIPYDKPELAAAHALAGQYLGMRFMYLEAGSGARMPVPAEMIRVVKHCVNIPLVVGGGIRSSEQALAVASAGADIIVTGNVVENAEVRRRVSDIIEGVKRGRL